MLWFLFALWLKLLVYFYSWLHWRMVRHTHTAEELPSIAPDAFVDIWLPIVLGTSLAIYWGWVFYDVARNWSDPVVRVLRFCSLALLLGQFIVISLQLIGLTLRLLNLSAIR